MKRCIIMLLSSCLCILWTMQSGIVTATAEEMPYLPNLRDKEILERAESRLDQRAQEGKKEHLVRIISQLRKHLERVTDPKSQYLLYTIERLTETVYLPQAIENFVMLTPEQIREYHLTHTDILKENEEKTNTEENQEDTTDDTLEQEDQADIPDTVFVGFQETGIASRYGQAFDGRKTANGEIFDSTKLTAAAPARYPFGTRVKVTNPKTEQRVVVRITDRGGFVKLGRVIDLSAAAFKAINNDSVSAGLLEVILEVVED